MIYTTECKCRGFATACIIPGSVVLLLLQLAAAAADDDDDEEEEDEISLFICLVV